MTQMDPKMESIVFLPKLWLPAKFHKILNRQNNVGENIISWAEGKNKHWIIVSKCHVIKF